jgi:hypothetical protein
MFNHKDIEKYQIEEVPLDRDIFLMDEKWMADYEHMLLKGLAGGEWDNPGFISYAAVRRVTADGLELSWYPNTHDRFHEMRIVLPRSSFITCVGCRSYDEKPHIFVKSEWLTDLHLRTNSVFAMVDAIGVKKALTAGAISTAQLDYLRDRIDHIALRNPDIAFVSFADSLLLKTNWSVGQWDSHVKYTYEPERIIHVLPEIAAAYKDALGLSVYAIVTQGRNEFYRDELMHVSSAGNHISLNSLGLPFAQLQAIEHAARAAIRGGDHGPAELYMDDHFFHSLKWQDGFEKHKEPVHAYLAPMADHPCEYVLSSFRRVIDHLRASQAQKV